MKIVYVLRDPFTNGIRYVGSTDCLRRRLNRHVSGARNEESQTAKGKWVKGILRRGKRPLIEEIERVSLPESLERERYWIRYYTERGERLLNMLHKRRFQKMAAEDGVVTRARLPGDVVNAVEAFRASYWKRTGVPLTKCKVMVELMRVGMAHHPELRHGSPP